MTGPPSPPPVRLKVGDAAVAAIAAAAARPVPGVVALRADLTRTALAGSVVGRPSVVEGVAVVAVDDDASAAEVAVTVVTRLGHNCRDLAAAVQRTVTHELVEQTGLTVRVRVTVAEVLLG